jgi:hypothetical protein
VASVAPVFRSGVDRAVAPALVLLTVISIVLSYDIVLIERVAVPWAPKN